MLLKRRTAPTFAEKLRVWIWPRRSWMRSTQYVTKRILRITATPYAIAAGVGVGVFTSFTPFMGLHFLLAFLLAWLVRGSMIASALGTFFGNPLTFPFIWAATYKTGHFLLGNEGVGSAAMRLGSAMKQVMSAIFNMDWNLAARSLEAIWYPLLYPMIIGGLFLGPLVAFPVYMLTKRAIHLFRAKRRNNIMERAKVVREKAMKLADEAKTPNGKTV